MPGGTVTDVSSVRTAEKKATSFRGGPGSPNGKNGFHKRGGGGSDHEKPEDGNPGDRYRVVVWVILAGVSMTFLALSGAYIARTVSSGGGPADALDPPPALWLSTLLILASSATLVASERNLKKGRLRAHYKFLVVTAVLGIGFLCSQLYAWRELVAQGVYLASNPHSAFFYLLTAIHAFHLILGLAAVLLITHRAGSVHSLEAKVIALREGTLKAVALYWHFLDGLWIYLFVLLFVWR
jgi:cytochrome c oxidase subunit III